MKNIAHATTHATNQGVTRGIAMLLVLLSSAAGAEESRFGQYDRDEDGQLNRAEVAQVQYLAVNFSRLDVNSDGYLSREEARSSHANPLPLAGPARGK